MIFSVFQKNWVFVYSWSTLLWYQCYYPHRSRDALSPVCGIFNVGSIFQTRIYTSFLGTQIHNPSGSSFTMVFTRNCLSLWHSVVQYISVRYITMKAPACTMQSQVVDRISGLPVEGPESQGELCVKTPQLFLGYRGEQVAIPGLQGGAGARHWTSQLTLLAPPEVP